MKHNLEHFSKIIEGQYSQIPKDMLKEYKFLKPASHKDDDATSEQIQSIVEEIISCVQTTALKPLVGSVGNYCRMMIDTYSNDYLSKVFDTKHDAGSSEYIVKAFRYYSEKIAQKAIRTGIKQTLCWKEPIFMKVKLSFIK